MPSKKSGKSKAVRPSTQKPDDRVATKRWTATAKDPSPPTRIPVVGVGGSAGGLESFVELLHHLPDRPQLAIVYVSHLAPPQGQELLDMLRRATAMPLKFMEDGDRPEVNHVMVVPPGKEATLAKGQFRLGTVEMKRESPDTIDRLFMSLAHEEAAWPIGLVLSGALSDGASGLASIRSEGGITLCQDPSQAKFDDMPKAAIATGAVDIVGSPRALARELVKISSALASQNFRPSNGFPAADWGNRTPILDLVHAGRGLDLRQYKQPTLRRRIGRRLMLSGKKSLDEYRKLLLTSPAELESLYQDLLINVTRFFREPEIFDEIKRTVFAKILAERGRNEPIRFWVPACATGEEVYSLAIAFHEFQRESNTSHPLHVFGTDVNAGLVAKARHGVYPLAIENAVSQERLSNFFTRGEGFYEIHKAIRDQCIFAVQNVLVDPPFSNIDFISCRNLLIYLDRDAQRNTLSMFHFALRPGGYLVLGASETVHEATHLFFVANEKARVYTRRSGGGGPAPRPEWRIPAADLGAGQVPGATRGPARRDMDRVLIDTFVPPTVLINDRFEIERFQGNTAPFIEQRSGPPSWNLLQVARHGLAGEVRNLVHRVKKKGRAATKAGLLVGKTPRAQRIRLRVLPVSDPGTPALRFLVVFQPDSNDAPRSEAAPGRRKVEMTRRIEVSERELRETRDFLRSMVEERDYVNEQLRVATEELESRNEELQSMNEELQTAKEELQSTNEELVSTNEQLSARNQELLRANADLTHLIAGTALPVIMLDRRLRIRRFSPAAARALNIRASDIDRPLGELNVPFPLEVISEAFEAAILRGRAEERPIRDSSGRWQTVSVVPIVGAAGQTDGAVLSFTGPGADPKKKQRPLRKSPDR